MNQLIAQFVPIFFLFIFIEVFYSLKFKKKFYNLKDSLSNLGTGSLNQMIELFTKPLLVGVYLFILEHFNVLKKLDINFWKIDFFSIKGFLSWVIIFILTDFIYYLFHRHSHENNFLWAFHIVHHSSEEYNLSVALRQSGLSSFFNWIYAMILALIGVPAEIFFMCYAINLIYQFFIHTRFIKNLGYLELFLNTPSHHRVHHARQGKYLDANYGGVFIIWDKLFGTFIPENEEPVYGIYPRFQSYDPVLANTYPLAELFRYLKMAPRHEKLKILTKGPLWIFEKFKKGKNLNIIARQNFINQKAFFFFILGLILSIILMNVSTIPVFTQFVLVICAFFLFKQMGKILDS